MLNRRFTIGYLLISIVAYALIPTLIARIGGQELPFFFLASWRAGVAVGCVAVLLVFYMPLWYNRQNWVTFRRHLATSETKAVDWRFPIIGLHIQVEELRVPVLRWKIPGDFIDWRILLAVLGNCEYALFAFSLNYIDVAVATIAFNSWPIFVLMTSALFLHRDSHIDASTKGTMSLLALFGVGAIGFIFVIFSQTGDFGEFGDVGLRNLVFGLALAAGAMALVSLRGFGIQWARNVGNQLSGSLRGLDNDPAMFFAIIALVFSSIGAVAVGVVVGLARGETADSDVLAMGFGAGLAVNALAGLLWRKVNTDETNVGYNALAYAIPVLALVFLFFFQEAGISRPEYLIIGATAILVASILVNFEAEIRWSFEALMLALGGCGTIVYMREDLFSWIGVPDWVFPDEGYFSSVSLAATIFTLLLAFRVARLVTRTSDEENRTFAILRRFDSLVHRGVIGSEVREYLCRIDESKVQSEIKQNYRKVRECILSATPLDESDRTLLREAETELDTLVRSNQVSPVLGEAFALMVFGGITIFLALFTKPGVNDGWIRLLVDMFAMLISAVIIFLLFYSFDLDRERDAHKLEKAEDTGEYLLTFPDTQARVFDQWLSIVVGILVVLAYAGLMTHRYLPDILPALRSDLIG